MSYFQPYTAPFLSITENKHGSAASSSVCGEQQKASQILPKFYKDFSAIFLKCKYVFDLPLIKMIQFHIWSMFFPEGKDCKKLKEYKKDKEGGNIVIWHILA